jgi:predicted glycoside hydrolase/deacetylase ChbG (UPF0249 family)
VVAHQVLRRGIFFIAALLWCMDGAVLAQTKTLAERLGYARDAKLLIIHADDLGLAHAVDGASFEAFRRGAITSASAMVPAPWFSEVAAYANQHPDHDIGLHLTHTSEWKYYRWGPVAPKDQVRGLLDELGYLWPDVLAVVKHAQPEEVEREIRAQVELAIRSGLKPTHLDSHMGTLFASPAFFAAYIKVARESQIPFFAPRIPNAPPELLAAAEQSGFLLDGFFMADERVKPEDWLPYYSGVVRALKPGVTEVIVHLGYDDAELQAVALDHPAFGSAWRQRDFNAVTSPEFKKVLEENHVTLIGWKELKKKLM